MDIPSSGSSVVSYSRHPTNLSNLGEILSSRSARVYSTLLDQTGILPAGQKVQLRLAVDDYTEVLRRFQPENVPVDLASQPAAKIRRKTPTNLSAQFEDLRSHLLRIEKGVGRGNVSGDLQPDYSGVERGRLGSDEFLRQRGDDSRHPTTDRSQLSTGERRDQFAAESRQLRMSTWDAVENQLGTEAQLDRSAGDFRPLSVVSSVPSSLKVSDAQRQRLEAYRAKLQSQIERRSVGRPTPTAVPTGNERIAQTLADRIFGADSPPQPHLNQQFISPPPPVRRIVLPPTSKRSRGLVSTGVQCGGETIDRSIQTATVAVEKLRVKSSAVTSAMNKPSQREKAADICNLLVPLPFVAGQSVTKSFSIRANLQELLAQLKSQHPVLHQTFLRMCQTRPSLTTDEAEMPDCLALSSAFTNDIAALKSALQAELKGLLELYRQVEQTENIADSTRLGRIADQIRVKEEQIRSFNLWSDKLTQLLSTSSEHHKKSGRPAVEQRTQPSGLAHHHTHSSLMKVVAKPKFHSSKVQKANMTKAVLLRNLDRMKDSQKDL